ncbi:MAG TPA: hypothetical protein VFN78_03555 [Ktedonobacterales bacterium]|nr:hypothetical protein [Ktedonobacterales bacterium]
MLIMSLIWLALGACVGALAIVARWTPPRWEGRSWWATPALGAGVALTGGWLATLLLDHIFATLVALCLSATVVTAAALLGRQRRVRSADTAEI